MVVDGVTMLKSVLNSNFAVLDYFKSICVFGDFVAKQFCFCHAVKANMNTAKPIKVKIFFIFFVSINWFYR